jgi:hypothetical protein
MEESGVEYMPNDNYEGDEPKLSEEEIRAIINSYQSFKYEPGEGEEPVNCAVCIDTIRVGTMVKSL